MVTVDQMIQGLMEQKDKIILTFKKINIMESTNIQKAKKFLKEGVSIKIHSLLQTFFLKPYNKTYYIYNSELCSIENLEKHFDLEILEVEAIHS